MDIEFILAFLGWCAAINIGLLLFWIGILVFFPESLYQNSCRWVSVSEEYFRNIHFLLIGTFKLTIVFFNLVPYFALRFMT